MWALPKRWIDFWGGVLVLCAGALSIGTGRFGNSIYRDLVATGGQARAIGVLLIIMGALLIVAAYRPRNADETKPPSK